jgi:hypothetical protein
LGQLVFFDAQQATKISTKSTLARKKNLILEGKLRKIRVKISWSVYLLKNIFHCILVVFKLEN